MKGLPAGRSQPPLCAGHTCGLAPPEDCELLQSVQLSDSRKVLGGAAVSTRPLGWEVRGRHPAPGVGGVGSAPGPWWVALPNSRKCCACGRRPADASDRAPSTEWVPQDEWGGYPAGRGKDEEIPCRRMRSGSYIKAMGDEESAESDSSPKTSPTAALLPEPLLKSMAARPLGDLQSQSYLQAASEVPIPHSLDPSAGYNSPKFRSRNQSYMRAVSTLSQASCVSQMSEAEVNGQFESVCESVFSEVESQAMDALDLPGYFRTRSHSYLQAIQAGYSQDEECVPMMTPSSVAAAIRSTAAATYANYKKTPPPVPPRTVSKPLISVTAQSSTESTQDAYQAQRMSPWPQDTRGLYNSTDSLDSNKAMSLALETAAAQRHAADSQSGPIRTSDKAILVSKAEELLKSRCSSIGVQDSEFPEHQPYPRSDVETATDSDTESRGLREYHSIGVQVEDEKRIKLQLPTFKFAVGFTKSMACVGSLQLERHLHTSSCWRPARLLGKIRSAVGSAQLLMSQKFQQFYWLCQQNMDPSAMPRPTPQDLAGYWDMLQLSVEDVSMKFDELQQLKLSDWKAMDSPERKEERKVPPPIPKKPPKGKFPITREKSLDLPDRQRQEARRRLMAAKRAASFRQNSATERADSIEIYIPEAQTRL
ncbi:PREDICTED: disks large-associated protein 2 [Dipodomys ordii]|uniref:Disks large-associated protein 2 n=1 Tax=Dipodomys ordii TaxID=10020 RepID=A0A1S3FV04_DIPOR|nr:PREDICTED: disks large-associated protein 2 [Dipodomys ordii]